MDDKSEALKARFFTDASEYLDRSKFLFAELAAGTAEQDGIHELFRCIHSIKSEASYLKMKAVGDIAHALEERLERIRTGSKDAEELSGARRLLDELERAFRSIQAFARMPSPARLPVFNLFEKRLLAEAKRHGELLYRLICELDPEAPMKQARAYLLLSNLEQLANVIRMIPEVHTQDDDAFQIVTVYLTAGIDESDLYKALDIDQIVRSSVEVLDYRIIDEGADRPAEGSISWSPEATSLYRLGSRKLGQLTAYADDLKITLKELDLDALGSEASHTLRGGLTRLSHVTSALAQEIRQIRVAPLAEEFQRLEQLVRDLAEQLGKNVNFNALGREIEVDRRNLMAISEPLSHLVRNAVDHGIEGAEQRSAAAKGEAGNVTITAAEDADRLSITVSDDGAGIDEASIRETCRTLGVDDEGDLIDLISRPGFSTLEHATAVSGRGVGLDLVRQRVESIGGEIRLETTVGKGTTFELRIPRGISFAQLLFFRKGQKLFAVSSNVVSDVRSIGKGDLKRSVSGRIFYQGMPAYSGEVEATVKGTKSFGAFAIVAAHLDRSACFLADDVLFEHDVEKNLLEPVSSGQARRLAVRFGSGRREFYYLPPSLITRPA